MIGLIVNILAVIIGGGIGCMLTGKFPTRIQRLILQFIGAVALFLGARAFIGGWFSDTSTAKETTGTLLVIFALLVGGVFGEAFRLDKLLDSLGRALGRFYGRIAAEGADGQNEKSSQGTPNRKEAIKQAKRATARRSASAVPAPKADSEKPRPWQISKLPIHPAPPTRTGSRFADGFVWATLLCALNAVSFTGTVTAVTTGEPKELFVKAAVDAVMVLFLASIYGMGPAFAALPIFVVEGIMLFVTNQWTALMTPTLLSHLTVIAATITIGVGVCLSFGKKWRVVNLLPAFLISPIYGLIVKLAETAIEK